MMNITSATKRAMKFKEYLRVFQKVDYDGGGFIRGDPVERGEAIAIGLLYSEEGAEMDE